ncbi:hypothetical protein [Streptomyces silvensis]|uniref:Uncharacterized protein n=1 Tax=Streptomyces silvensis TaxID=1765722 RepID=A0A0W7WWV2_9ACTN|nr:hypothetical protein AT728_26695 [Streptomyces silvensis]
MEQFAEVFTVCQGPAQRHAFTELPMRARDWSSGLLVVLVVLAVRTVFYARCRTDVGRRHQRRRSAVGRGHSTDRCRVHPRKMCRFIHRYPTTVDRSMYWPNQPDRPVCAS